MNYRRARRSRPTDADGPSALRQAPCVVFVASCEMPCGVVSEASGHHSAVGGSSFRHRRVVIPPQAGRHSRHRTVIALFATARKALALRPRPCYTCLIRAGNRPAAIRSVPWTELAPPPIDLQAARPFSVVHFHVQRSASRTKTVIAIRFERTGCFGVCCFLH